MRVLLQRVLWMLALTALMAGVVGCAAVLTYVSGSHRVGGGAALLFGVPLLLAGAVKIPGGGGDVHDIVWGVVAGVIAATIALAGGHLVSEYAWVARGAEVHDISPDALIEHPDATRIWLRDAHLAPKAKFTHSHGHRSGKNTSFSTHVVAPIVPKTWQPGEPVRLYAACNDHSGDANGGLAAWDTPARAVVRVPPDDEECFLRTVPSAALPPDGRVVFVHWVEPEAYLAQRRENGSTFLRIVGIVWLTVSLTLVVGPALWFTVSARKQ